MIWMKEVYRAVAHPVKPNPFTLPLFFLPPIDNFYFRRMPSDIKTLQKQTETLLKKVKEEKLTTDDIFDLREALRFHEHRYYIHNDPLISDFEYDSLYKGLEKLEDEA